jgi:hypothetical protein
VGALIHLSHSAPTVYPRPVSVNTCNLCQKCSGSIFYLGGRPFASLSTSFCLSLPDRWPYLSV